MKKIIIIALAVMATTAFAATPAKKNKKQTVKTETAAPVKMSTKADTLSYAAGMYTTRGLMDYVKRQYGIDSTNMQAFVEGVKEGIERQNDKNYIARNAGTQIAQMLDSRIYPNMKNDFKDMPWQLDSVKFNAGFIAAIINDTTVMSTSHGQEYFTSTMQAEKKHEEEKYKAENVAWLKLNATKDGVKTTASGLQYKVITEGKGEVAGKDDEVTVKYEGRTIDGKVFDSSYKRNPDTSTFRPTQVIKGWTEALTMMPTGSKWELYIPQELAYGARKAGQIKPYSTLIFTVELVKVEKAKAAADNASGKDSKKTVAAKKITPAKKVAKKK